MLRTNATSNHPVQTMDGLTEALKYIDLRRKDLNELTKDIISRFQADELGAASHLDYCVIGYNKSLIGRQYYIKHTNGHNKPDQYFTSFYEAVAYILRVFW